MQERQVTAGGNRHPLPDPFFVLATQNPVEQEGTYPLPEAQLDRFMFNIHISYPDHEDEREIVRRTTSTDPAPVEPVIDGSNISEFQSIVRGIPIADHVVDYAVRLTRSTRVDEHHESAPDMIREYVSWGAGPRASQYLVLAAKARAAMTGSPQVNPSHIRDVVLPVLRHRILLNFNAESDGITSDMIIHELVDRTSIDGTDPDVSKQMDQVMN